MCSGTVSKQRRPFFAISTINPQSSAFGGFAARALLTADRYSFTAVILKLFLRENLKNEIDQYEKHTLPMP